VKLLAAISLAALAVFAAVLALAPAPEPPAHPGFHTEIVPAELIVEIMPVGEIEPDWLAEASRAIGMSFRVRANIASAMALPEPAFDEARKQYNGDWILRLAGVLISANAFRTVLVTSEPIYSGDLPRICYLVSPDSKMILVSTAGMSGPEGIELPVEKINVRIRRLAVRAVAASLDITECENDCILSGESRPESLDSLPDYFCTRCAQLLDDKTGTGIGSPYGHFRAAMLYLEDGSVDGAIEELNKAVELKRDFISAYLNLSELYLQKGWHAEAVTALRRAVSAAPGSVEPRTRLAQVLLLNNQAPAAVEELRAALAIEPQFLEAHRLMGIACHFYILDFDSARKHYRAYLRFGGHSEEIKKLLEELESLPGVENKK